MIARLERHKGRRATDIIAALACIAQSARFSVFLTATAMPPLAERDPIANDHAADRRVRSGIRDRSRREFRGSREVRRVGRYGLTSTPFQNAT
jgi:hypothetical protein